MKKTMIVKGIIIILGLVFIAWFLLPVFATHNLNIGAATGTGIGILLLLYGIWFRRINTFVAHTWRNTAGKVVEILLLCICAGILVLAVMTSVAMISAASGSAQPDSTVIVLGARVYQNRPSLTMARRLDAAYQYLEENPESMCIVSGGQGDNEPCTESSVMKMYLVGKGISPERIIEEDRSTDTSENIAFSKKIIEEQHLNPVVALATDGYHEYRALGYAHRAGLEAGAVPASTVWWLFPTSVVREMYGILEQWFLKR